MARLIAQRYELIDEIGSGGMGTVYRGLDRQLQSAVAIKHLKRAISQPEHIARFLREGDALRVLNHPNIVAMLDAVHEGDDYYLILEYLAGGDLASLLRHGSLAIEQILNLLIDIAAALTRAHHLNIIHRDLKPANVLLAQDGTPRLTDFGIAHLESAERLTVTGAVIGTTAYLSPEALDGNEINTSVDIWAFGVMLFEMVTGMLPFRGATASQTITAILFDSIPDVEVLRPDCPTRLIDLIYRMLVKDPAARISSIRLVGLELEAVLAGVDLTDAPQRAEPSLTARTSSERFSVPLTHRHQVKHHLPQQAFPFVGREPELDELATLIADGNVRLITVLGPGGMGKTRLALQAAAQQVANFTHGVHFVALASLTAPNMIVPAIAEVIGCIFQENGLSTDQQFFDYLSEKQLLLLLDNFEHLISGVDVIEQILQNAPRVKILVTSRERLNLSAETLFSLDGMSVPDHVTEDALDYSGVQLFVQSARRVRPNFQVKVEDFPAIIQICQRVDGMPLGIVLAAAWVEMLAPEEIITELNHSMDFLETEWRDLPERQRSLRGVFDYSWRLLNPSEQSVLMRLSIFRGGFTREAAEQITGANLRALMSLMNKSLLSRNRDSGRYSLHELTRQYAEDKLRASGEADETARRHSAYYLVLADEKAVVWRRSGSLEARRSFETDAQNVHMAWSFAVSAKSPDLIALGAETMGVFYTLSHWIAEGQRLNAAALAALPDRTSETAGLLLASLANFAFDTDLCAQSEAYAQQAVTILRQSGSNRTLKVGLEILAYSSFCNGRLAESDRASWEAYELAQSLGEDFVAFNLVNQLARNARQRSDLVEARRLTEMLLQNHPQNQVDPAVVFALQTLASLTYSTHTLGDHAQAKELMQTALTHAQETGDLPNIAGALIWLTIFYFSERDFERAYDYGKQALEASREAEFTLMTVTAESILSGISSVKGDFVSAKIYLRSSLLRSCNLPPHRGLLRAVSAAPLLLLLSGNPVQSLEIISLLWNTPNVEPMITSLLAPFRQMCETNLPAEVAQATWEHGKTLDLNETVQRLLEMLGSELKSP